MGAAVQQRTKLKTRTELTALEATPIYDAVAAELATDLIRHTEPLPLPTFATMKITKAKAI